MNRFTSIVVVSAIATIAFAAAPATASTTAAAGSTAPTNRATQKAFDESVFQDFRATDIGNGIQISGSLKLPDEEALLWSRLRLYKAGSLIEERQVALKPGAFDQLVTMERATTADRVELRVGTDQNMYSVDSTNIRFQTTVTDHHVDQTGTTLVTSVYSPEPGRDYKLVIKPWAGGGPNVELLGRGSQDFTIHEVERSSDFVCATIRIVDAKTGQPLSAWIDSRARVNP